MRRSVLSLALLAIVLTCLHAVPAQAQPIRVFVALTGNDANQCTFASPCKSAQHAHDVVAAGGEIRMLDPGSYGLLTITKAISILGEGHGGIAAQNGAVAITINAGASDKIHLRGLVIEGFGSGLLGIRFNTGASLSVQDCVVRNFFNTGVVFAPTGSSQLFVIDTRVERNGSDGISIIPPSSGTISGTIDHVASVNNQGAGFDHGHTVGTATSDFAIGNSVMSNNQFGIAVSGLANGTSTTSAVTVWNSAVNNNQFDGLHAGGANTTLRVTKSNITRNGTGFSTLSGGTIISFGDNSVDGNTTNGAPTSTIVLH